MKLFFGTVVMLPYSSRHRFVLSILCNGVDLFQGNLSIAIQIGRHGWRQFLKGLYPRVIFPFLCLLFLANDTVRDDKVAVAALFRDVALRLIVRSRLRCPVVINTHNLYSVAPGAESVAAQQDGERLTEVSVEGIDDGVERGVGPTEPDEDIEGGGTDAREVSALVGVAERNHAVQYKEGQPAAHKHAHDDRQGFENFGFTLEGHLEGTFRLHTCVVSHATVAVLGTLCRTLQGGYPAYLLLGDAVDSGVSDQHDGHWDVKTDERRGNGVRPIKAGVAVVRWKLAEGAV